MFAYTESKIIILILSEMMGALAETAIFSQWFHSDTDLHYARWQNGEVDIVRLSPKQKPEWAVEVKWSDRYAEKPRELRSLLNFSEVHHLEQLLVTTRTLQRTVTHNDIVIDFKPSSLYCYEVGRNLVRHGTAAHADTE